MALLSLYPQVETNLMSNRNVINLLLQLKDAEAHCKNYMKVKAQLVRYLLRNLLLQDSIFVDYFGESLVVLSWNKDPPTNPPPRRWVIRQVLDLEGRGFCMKRLTSTYQAKWDPQRFTRYIHEWDYLES